MIDMNKKKIEIDNMWREYLLSIKETPQNTNKTFKAWFFGDEKLANPLAKLVLDGKKTGTTSLYCLYKLEGEDLPKVGEHSIILDFDNNPQCVIEIIKVEVLPFNTVSKEFAISEGEGDLSLNYWRAAHKSCFEIELLPFKKIFNEGLKVVCETFKVVYKN